MQRHNLVSSAAIIIWEHWTSTALETWRDQTRNTDTTCLFCPKLHYNITGHRKPQTLTVFSSQHNNHITIQNVHAHITLSEFRTHTHTYTQSNSSISVTHEGTQRPQPHILHLNIRQEVCDLSVCKTMYIGSLYHRRTRTNVQGWRQNRQITFDGISRRRKINTTTTI